MSKSSGKPSGASSIPDTVRHKACEALAIMGIDARFEPDGKTLRFRCPCGCGRIGGTWIGASDRLLGLGASGDAMVVHSLASALCGNVSRLTLAPHAHAPMSTEIDVAAFEALTPFRLA